MPELPDTTAYLPLGAYDCTAAGPFVAPGRPHAETCFRDPGCTARLVAGHRMANPFAPENSLSALRAAILLGVDIVETDVRATADGQVVFIHDAEVDRTTTGSGNVDQLTLAEVRQFALEPEPSDPPGDWSCERLPTLDEVFALARGEIIVELEVKSTQGGVLSAEYLRDNDLYDHAFMLCDPDECAAIRAAVPDVPIMSRPREAAEVAAEIAYDPPPIMVHIDPTPPFLDDAILAEIHGLGAKAYGNAFTLADVAASGIGDLSYYPAMFDDGLDVLQSEYPHYALQALGRVSPRP